MKLVPFFACLFSPLCRGIILLTLLVPGNLLTLQAESTSALYFMNLTTREGLSSNVTNSIVQDTYGFVWIGTQEGLCRFDGYKMQYFRSGNGVVALSSDNISCLLLDGDRLWEIGRASCRERV